MSDFNSALPIRSELVGQVTYEDIIVKIGDATNPATQQANVDTFGSMRSRIADAAGNIIASQALSASNWLQVVDPTNGPAAPGTSASFSQLIGGQFNTVLPTLTNGQQSAIQVDSSGRLLVVATSTDDHNYGVVGANTLRTAAQIGNATGAADFNFGAVGAQTLRAAAQIGNATGAADFNAGATGAQTLRTTSNQGTPGTAANAWFVKVTDGTNTQVVTAGGAADVNAVNFPTTVDTNYGTVGASTIRTAAQVGNATGAADFNNGATGAQTLRVAANLAVAGANVSSTNPVPVTLTGVVTGTSVNNYNTVAAVAAGATSNHIYTITAGKTFAGKKIWATASGALKIEVRVSPDGAAYSTLWVGFNSTATPNITIDLDELVFLESGVGSTIEVIRTNEDKKAMDVYSTISGTETP